MFGAGIRERTAFAAAALTLLAGCDSKANIRHGHLGAVADRQPGAMARWVRKAMPSLLHCLGRR
jgi:hypothetical protein